MDKESIQFTKRPGETFSFDRNCECTRCHAYRKEYWHKWLLNIASDILPDGKCPQGLIEHIAKHFTTDLQKHYQEKVETGSTDWHIWIASALNLVAILEITECGYFLSPEIMLIKQVERLQVKYDHNPETHTAPPE